MKPFPSDSMAQHSRMIDAFCEDLLAGEYHAPRAKAVSEISRQLSKGDCAETRTVAGAPSGLSRDASQAKPLIDYRKEASGD